MLATDLVLQSLRNLGSDAVEHLNSDLTDHLRSTHDRLRSWQSPERLRLSGLFHAVYGTYGFHHQLVGVHRRDEVASIIGRQAESIVYFYCACDRAYFYPRLAKVDRPECRDRFSGEIAIPEAEMVRDFCELTAANEIDVMTPNREGYLAQYGRYVLPLFNSVRFRRNLSDAAAEECERLFSEAPRGVA
jgi:hypothetical protein